ncbi:MAG TPA: hypothetical protein ENK91_05850, partial [Bacteroidetes bacterium]|nr:hypothetical protein [Bacteroidota bacterium]
MNNRFFKKFYYLFFSMVLISTFSIKSLYSQDISVNVFLEPPYPLELSAYLEFDDQLVVGVTNTSGSAREIKLNVEVNGPGGFQIPAQRIMEEAINLPAGETITYTGAEIRDMTDIDEDDVDYGEYSKEDIIRTGMLPEGDYSICVAAFDFNTDERLSAGAPDDCYDFTLNYAEIPEIITPENEAEIPTDEIDHITVTWSDPAFSMFDGTDLDIEYTLQIVDLEDTDYPDVPPQEYFDDGIPVFFEETIDADGSGFSTYIIEDAGFEPGHQYAIRVTAEDKANHISYREGGHSEVHQFLIPGSESDCSFSDPGFEFRAEAIYPGQADTIPFGFIPCVMEIFPHCENYTRLVYKHISTRADHGSTPDYDRDLVTDNWPEGPRAYLIDEMGAEEPLEDRPWQFISNLREEQEAAMPLVRGKRYIWNMASIQAYIGSDSREAETVSSDYYYGMTKPVLSTPENQDTLDPGDIDFEFAKGTAPANLLPEVVKLLAVDRGDVEGALNIGNVRERWVLQVFTSQEFDESNLVYTETGLVDESPDQEEETVSEHVYGAETLSHAFNDQGDYWWRVIWLKNPEMEIPSNNYYSEDTFYLSSPVWKFTIHEGTGGGGGGGDEDEEEPVAGCGSDCLYTNDIAETNISSLNTGDTVH